MVRLEDVFQRFPQTPMSVEVKAENKELVQKVLLPAVAVGIEGLVARERPGSPLSLTLVSPDSRPGAALWA